MTINDQLYSIAMVGSGVLGWFFISLLIKFVFGVSFLVALLLFSTFIISALVAMLVFLSRLNSTPHEEDERSDRVHPGGIKLGKPIPVKTLRKWRARLNK